MESFGCSLNKSRECEMGSFTQLNYHVVFATKYRKRVIANTVQESMYKYIGGIIRDFEVSIALAASRIIFTYW